MLREPVQVSEYLGASGQAADLQGLLKVFSATLLLKKGLNHIAH